MNEFDLPPGAQLNYLNRRMAELSVLQNHLQSQNWHEVFTLAKQMGHQIRGNAISFGFGELTAIAVDLEKAGLDQSKKEVEVFTLRLQEHVQNCLRKF